MKTQEKSGKPSSIQGRRAAILRRATSGARCVEGSRSGSLMESLEARQLLAADMAPTAKSAASAIASWTNNYSFKVTYTDDKNVRVSTIDSNDLTVRGPNGFSQNARLVSTSGSGKTYVAKYKLVPPSGLWQASDNGSYSINLKAGQVTDTKGNATAAGKIGSFVIDVGDFPSDLTSKTNNSVPIWAVNVKDFGALPNDGVDDSAAIQAAINSLPDYSVGVPLGSSTIGGIVYIPAGTYNISTPLSLDSGIVLMGAGSTTILSSKSANSNDSVIRFHSRQSHGFVAQAGVEDLAINTLAAKGIDASPTDPGDLISLHMSDLSISSGGTAIDLHTRNVYQSSFNNITVTNPGSGALWVTVATSTGNSALDSITNFTINGTARSGFVTPNAMVYLNGDFNVNGLTINDIGARVLPLYGQRLLTFRALTINTSTANLSTGAVAQFNSARNIDIDALSNIGLGRVLALTDAHTVHIGTLTLPANGLLKNVATYAGSSHLVADTVQTLSGTMGSALSGVDSSLVSVRSLVVGSSGTGGQTSGSTTTGTVRMPIEADSPLSIAIADAAAFGATGNDSSDDTNAIQRAIDSLPRGNGLTTGGTNIVGGAVFLPVGRLLISHALRLPSGVWLEGRGSATLLFDTDTQPTDAAIQIVAGAAAGYNVGAGVENLGLFTSGAAGIRADASLTSGLIDLQLLNLEINAGGDSIDLRAVKTFHSLIQNIAFAQSGSLDLWIGDDANYSADNAVRDIYVANGNRSTYSSDRAMFVFEGQTSVENFWLEEVSAVSRAIYASGDFTLRGLWLEYPTSSVPADKDVVELANCTHVYIDRLTFIDNEHHLKISNSQNVNIGWLDIAGEYDVLHDVLDMDAGSKLTLGTVNAIRDVGSLDDSRLVINGNFDQTANNYVDTFAARSATNLLNDISTWVILWGDQYGAVTGTATITQGANGPQMTINITSNPYNRNVSVLIGSHVPPAYIGKQAVATWRVDGAGQAIAYTYGFGTQYSGRAMNTKTASNLPGPLTGSDVISILLPALTGTFIVSGVSLSAIG